MKAESIVLRHRRHVLRRHPRLGDWHASRHAGPTPAPACRPPPKRPATAQSHRRRRSIEARVQALNDDPQERSEERRCRRSSSATSTSTPSSSMMPSSGTEQALQLDPKNADASTDLGISLYYTNQADEALAAVRALAEDQIPSIRRRCSTKASSSRSASGISRPPLRNGRRS